MNKTAYDVIVVGGGHAGIEAAWAAARMGSRTALVTLDSKTIGAMPCNPAIGGIGKGHLVFEISAFGGLMPQLCSKTYLQARMLNTRKGPAVQGLRLQIDKHAYSALSQKRLAEQEHLTVMSARVDDVVMQDGTIRGVMLHDSTLLQAASVIITSGTFLNGKVHIGNTSYDGGRRGEKAVHKLSDFLREQGIKMGRLKTGTPPRLLHSTIDYSQMEEQEAAPLSYLFEFAPCDAVSSHPCHITYTNEQTHKIIADNLAHSAMYSGNIKGIGPRYCPSIEDKISRFAHKTSHHVFVEPDDAMGQDVYPNGLSTSLPADVQEAYIRSIKGFENAVISKLGYAIEYDFVEPRQLDHTLQLKALPGLFLAGQINGTTGYEEAGAQGLLAGINAHLKAHGKAPFTLDRTESYIGVMVDDLVTMGVDEPYRMFTSRAERRLLLRQDNVFARLSPYGYALGLVDETTYKAICEENKAVEATVASLQSAYSQAELQELCSQPEPPIEVIKTHAPTELGQRAMVSVQAACMYAPYLKREEVEIQRRNQYKDMTIPADLPIRDLPGLSKELQEKLLKYQPATIADAALIPGMTPAAISLLIFKMKNFSRQKGLGKQLK